MRYEFFTTFEAAKARLTELQSQDYLGHIIRLSRDDYELTYWPKYL